MFARQFVARGAKMSSCTKLLRALHSKAQSLQYEVNEIEIPVPWGKIAGKLWGSQDKQPLLAMHGWQDNAGSFDNLAPLLVKNTPVLAIDLPGHGLSSWLPPGFIYNELVYFLLVKRIQRHFGWKKLKVMGHSLSAMTMYWYAAAFSMDLQYVVALDLLKFPGVDTAMYTARFAQAIDGIFKLEESNRVQPSYTQSEILKRGLAAYEHFYLDETAYKVLMTRGITQKEDGMYVFNRDPRLRFLPVHSMFSQEQLQEFAKIITCPYLIIKGDPNFYAEEKEHFYDALKILTTSNDKVQFEILSSPSHHFHLTHAEATADIINPFLEKYD